MGTCGAGSDACIDADVAIAFVDGALAPNARAEIEQRIDRCGGCRIAIAAAARGAGRSAATRVERPGGRAEPAPRPEGDPATDLDVPTGHDAPGLAPGEAVGRYIVERPIGAGGMGVVSLARDPELKRAVVIKLVRPDAFDGEGHHELEARLRREAQAMAQLSHPNVVQIFDIGRHGDRVFLAMEFIPGQTLDAWLIEQPRSVAEILAMFRQAGAGLAAAHRAGLLHRDFKPTNVLVNRDGIAKVTDFGLARAFGATAPPTKAVPRPRMSGVHAVLTQLDAVVGTPAYMAPEQALGKGVDARTDQYALALTLLDALVGQQPSKRKVDPTRAEEIEPALAKADVPARVRAAISRALCNDPEGRFPTLDGFLDELAPVRRDRKWVVIAGLAICAGAATTWFALRQGEAPACVSESSLAWVGSARDRVVATIGGQARPFAAWTAEQVAQAIDKAVDELAADELAKCNGAAARGSGSVACVAARRRALAPALAALVTLSPGDDPWRHVQSIASCDPRPDEPARAALRAELAKGVTAARARQIADRARSLDDDRLRADALEIAGRAALVVGKLDEAALDFGGMDTAGEHGADEATKGRHLLAVLELARWRGDHAAAMFPIGKVDASVQRHGSRPRDVLLVANAEADALLDLQDGAGFFAANRRALDAAETLGSDDARLHARTRQARGVLVLHLDPDEARHEIDKALADTRSAGQTARAEANMLVGELSLLRGDGPSARAAFAEAGRLDPSLASSISFATRVAQARGLEKDVAGALAALDQLRAIDPADRIRIEVARSRVLRKAGRADEAHTSLATAWQQFDTSRREHEPLAMPNAEMLELALEYCENAPVDPLHLGCYIPPELRDGLPKQAPARARDHLQHARFGRTDGVSLKLALEIMIAAQVAPKAYADVEWKVAQDEVWVTARERWTYAKHARDVFAAEGRHAEAATIDAWLATRIDDRQFDYVNEVHPDGQSPADAPADAPRAPSGDPWSP